MADSLLVIESPNKCKSIAHYTGIPTVATVGHFMGLPDKELGVDLAHDYAPDFRPTSDVYRRLRAAAQGKVVYLGPDPDREGYAIAMHVYEQIKGVAKEVRRIEIHEITEKGVKKALAESMLFQDTNFGLYHAFLGRRIFDRVIGWGLSGLVSAGLGIRGLSAGRVQSTALRLIVDREQEIRAFAPQVFFRLRLEGLCGPENGFWLEHTTKRFATAQIAQFAKSKAVAAGCGTVTAVEKGRATEAAKAPFTTATLQATANKRLGLAAKETMALAQKLFEGGEKGGYITYMRTDSVRIVPEIIDEIRAVLVAQFGPQSIPTEPNSHKSKNSQAEAHEAIRPTNFPAFANLDSFCQEMLTSGMDQAHVKLFRLIYLHTLASQMAPAEYDTLKILADFGGEAFQATGRALTAPGWKAVYASAQAQTTRLESEDEPGQDGEDNDQAQGLPLVVQGQRLTIGKTEIPEGKTKPPIRYTEGTLVEALESREIGRPATYAGTIATLFKRGYVVFGTGKGKRQLAATDLGEKNTDFLKERHPFVVDYELTREIEKQLDLVEARKLSWVKVVRDYHAKLNFIDPRKIERATGQVAPQRVSLGPCPKCKGPVIDNGTLPYWGCDNYAPEKGACPFKLYKVAFGHTLTQAQASRLLGGHLTASFKLKRRDGTEFQARLRLENNRVEPIFDNGGSAKNGK